MKNSVLSQLADIQIAIDKLSAEIDLNYAHPVSLKIESSTFSINVLESDSPSLYSRKELIQKLSAHLKEIESDVRLTSETALNTLKKCEAKTNVLFGAILTLASLDSNHLAQAKAENPLYNYNRNIFSSFQQTATVILANEVETFMEDYNDNNPSVRMTA